MCTARGESLREGRRGKKTNAFDKQEMPSVAFPKKSRKLLKTKMGKIYLIEHSRRWLRRQWTMHRRSAFPVFAKHIRAKGHHEKYPYSLCLPSKSVFVKEFIIQPKVDKISTSSRNGGMVRQRAVLTSIGQNAINRHFFVLIACTRRQLMEYYVFCH